MLSTDRSSPLFEARARDTAKAPPRRRAISPLVRALRQFSASQAFSELLQKRWTEAFFPFLMMVIVIAAAAIMIPGYASPDNLTRTGREFAEFGFVAMAMAIVLISGGIDLSVGAVFALANMLALLLLGLMGWPVWAVIPAVLAFGGLIGAWNGLLVGYIKTRPFITTLTTLIIGRAAVNLLDQRFSGDLAGATIESKAWEFIGSGSLLGIPTNVALLAAVAVAAHMILTRSRIGSHITATGGDRRAALHAGIDIRRVLLNVYVLSGVLAALAGVLYAARLDSGSSNAGRGMEIMALAAAVLGGVSLAGGRGSVGRALIGATIILVLINALVRFGVSGSAQSIWLGLVVLAAVAADVRWGKNRRKTLDATAIVPGMLKLTPPKVPMRGDGGEFAVNNDLQDAIPFGEFETAGPGDIVFDRDGVLYTGTSEGWVVRYRPETHYRAREYWLRTGGWPLGLQFDAEDRLVMCIAGRGLYRATKSGDLQELTTQTNRSWSTVRDDSRLRVPSDLDIVPDGTIFFGEGTTRHEIQSWTTDALEGRGNGALIQHDPRSGKTRTVFRGIPYCSGVCLAHDASAIYVSAAWEARIYRLPLSGRNAGRLEPFMDDLPGFPAMINRASDGGYWVAFCGVRTPAYNLAMRMPGFRQRMTRRLPPDEWLMPNFNVGLIGKFDDSGRIVRSLWDALGRNFAMLGSVRENRGYLYFGSIGSTRFGRKKLADADPTWTSARSYWGTK